MYTHVCVYTSHHINNLYHKHNHMNFAFNKYIYHDVPVCRFFLLKTHTIHEEHVLLFLPKHRTIICQYTIYLKVPHVVSFPSPISYIEWRHIIFAIFNAHFNVVFYSCCHLWRRVHACICYPIPFLLIIIFSLVIAIKLHCYRFLPHRHIHTQKK